MAEQKLPTPVVVPEIYLAAILDELRTLNKLLGAASVGEADEVALKEPAKKPAHRDAVKKPIGTERKG